MTRPAANQMLRRETPRCAAAYDATIRQRKTNASGLNPTVRTAVTIASFGRRNWSSFNVASMAVKPSEYAYSPVNIPGAAARTPNTRDGQRAVRPHSRIAIDEKRTVEATAAAKTSGRFPTISVGR